MAAVDVTDDLLQKYAEASLDLRRVPEDAPPGLHPQAAEMFVKMAEHATHRIDLETADYEDYTVPVTGLALTNCLVACEYPPVPPSGGIPLCADPWVRAAFSRQLMAELNREQLARLRHGIWRSWYDPQTDIAHHRLTKRRRQSALLLLNHQAQPALLQHLLGHSLQDLSPDALYHALAASPEVLSFITQTDPAGWKKFETAVGTDIQGMSALAGFLSFLRFAAETVGHSYWYDEPFLVKLWSIHTRAFPQYASINSNSLLEAVRRFSMAPSEAASYLIHPPFFLLHGRYLRNPCFLGAHNPIVGLLIIAIRRHEQVWSETLGSSLARAADTLASMLPNTARLKIVARRKYSGGDVDLALYDVQTRELLICEVKTVFDKHRADSLIHRFEEAKVNVHRAASQLRETKRAIVSGQVSLEQLFGIQEPPPTRLHMALLTWFDPIDVTMDTSDEDILSLNFATFLWLTHVAAGDVQALAAATRDLRNLWTIAQTRPLDLGQPELTTELEVQTGLLDARESLATLPLSSLSRRIVDQMHTVDDVPSPNPSGTWISYLQDTRLSLAPAA